MEERAGAVVAYTEWRGERIPQLMLGTVQLGMAYGIANRSGRPDQSRATAIVDAAWRAGVRYFDTAQAYGESERVLGEVFRELGIADECAVSSKLSAQLAPSNLRAVEESIEHTFARLGVERLWCMLLHDPAWLAQWNDGLGELLLRYRREGRIAHLGVSLRTVRDAPEVLTHADLEVLQVPSNAWDRRAVEWGVLGTALERGQLPCIRSVYLQGLLVLSPDEVQAVLPRAHTACQRWRAFASDHGLAPGELALRYALGLGVPLVVGAETPEQVLRTAQWAQAGPLPADIVDALGPAVDGALDEVILEPNRWGQ